MSIRVWVSVAFLLAARVGAQQPVGFPHERHAKLFPDCLGCHAGVVSGETAAILPSNAVCAQCHNNRDVKPVQWAGAMKRPSNLQFSHTQHAADIKAGPLAETCTTCHAANAEARWMEIARAAPEACVSCHTASEHLAENAVCTTCHVKLTDAKALSVSRIAAFPKPPTHARADFAGKHAPATREALSQCATCHTRESCARCHLNASKVGSIAQLGTDARVAQLVKGKAPAYFTPASHKKDVWALDHGKLAAQNAASCANCHARSTCQSCHTGSKGAGALAMLATPGKDDPAGVASTRTRVHPANFEKTHKTTAGSGRLDCQGCHKQEECTSCHEGTGTRKYHASDFVSRHATSAYGQDQNCASCHRTETFCRSCHQQTTSGLAGTRTGAVHTGQPMWLLQHGQAARQGLTGCTSCHQQRDCLQCHSNLGWSVNPHGSSFDASRMSARNKAVCRTCHLTDPLAKP